MKKLLLAFFLIANLIFSANYTSKIVGDANGNIYIKENVNEVHPFASLTKMMTSIIVIESIEKGKINYDDFVKVPKEATLNKGSTVDLKKDQLISVRDLLYATLVHSANDAAYTLAYYLSKGNIPNFVTTMNKKAKEIGMKSTTFCTPNGLPTSMTGKGMDRGTALDMYKLSAYVAKNQKFIEIASTQHTSIMGGKTSFDNRNTLLGTVPGVIGLKTGFHDDAKYNMAVAFNKEGKLYLAVLFGGNSMKIRDSEMKRTVLDFSPKMDEEKIIYVEEPVNTYVKPKVTTNLINTTNFYIPDSTSIIDTNLNRKEYENSGFNSPIIVK